MAAIQLTRTHRLLVGVVLAGAALIAAIGFVGSYAAVRDLAERKGFGDFAPFFPIGIDAGIVVLLALDLLLTWLRIPFPLLRQTAWLLTAATVAFNGAAAWGDPLAVGMHGIIPVLFIITVEAARHAIGRITDIAADRHMEGVRMWRWVLAPVPTFRLWRRMKLWELRSYQEVIDLERDRLVYRARLRARYGRRWRRRAPVEARLPLKLAHLGVPLDPQLAARPTPATAPERTPAGAVSPPGVVETAGEVTALGVTSREVTSRDMTSREVTAQGVAARGVTAEEGEAAATRPEYGTPSAGTESSPVPGEPTVADDGTAGSAASTRTPRTVSEPDSPYEPVPAVHSEVTVPVGPGRRRHLTHPSGGEPFPTASGVGPSPAPPSPSARGSVPEVAVESTEPVDEPVGLPSDQSQSQAFYAAYLAWIGQEGSFPNARQLSRFLHDTHGVRNTDGSLLSEQYLRGYLREFKDRYRAEAGV